MPIPVHDPDPPGGPRRARGDRPPDDEGRRRFEALHAAHFAAVTGYVRRRVPDRESAADAVSETFLVAWRRLEAVPAGDGTRLWLYGTARRVPANHRRAERRRDRPAHEIGRDLALRLPDPDRTARDGTPTEIGRAFRSLPERDRGLPALVAWEGPDRAGRGRARDVPQRRADPPAPGPPEVRPRAGGTGRARPGTRGDRAGRHARHRRERVRHDVDALVARIRPTSDERAVLGPDPGAVRGHADRIMATVPRERGGRGALPWRRRRVLVGRRSQPVGASRRTPRCDARTAGDRRPAGSTPFGRVRRSRGTVPRTCRGTAPAASGCLGRARQVSHGTSRSERHRVPSGDRAASRPRR